ncbi:Crp/Fnr family transcriptional regulator [Phenylobacterium sp.]|jgi:CRP-like cAMP-binding protein|uniref:Crp/Fnr family transcriptional regulator n=1 Tax=Phenylobacterium sp. TaxID=1871053 RepID=UPI002F9576BC
MSNPLTMKLEQFTRLDTAERNRLDQLLNFPTETYAPRKVIIERGDKVQNIHLVLSGLAMRRKELRDGSRQVMAFLIPGDLCDVEVFVLQAMDHDIVAVAETTCVLIPADTMVELLTESSNLTWAMWWGTMVDSAILREWIVDHGARDARERLAHLFYEMLVRYRVVGATTDNSYPFPVTQELLADGLGLTSVHVNRVLQELRAEDLIEFENKVVTIPDPARLKKAAKFEADYLHLVRTEARDGKVAERAADLVPMQRQAVVQRAVRRVKDRFSSQD